MKLVIALILQFGSLLQALELGTIKARVLDTNGKPVAGAKVWMIPQIHESSMVIPDCITNSEGICERNNLQLEPYRICAEKESEGYPNISIPLYEGKQKLQVRELNLKVKSSSVTIVLGPKAGILSLQVIDAATGAPVRDATVTVRPVDAPTDFMTFGVGSNSKVLVPPHRKFFIEITANGFKTWKHEAAISAGKPLTLGSGQLLELMVKLQSESPSSQ